MIETTNSVSCSRSDTERASSDSAIRELSNNQRDAKINEALQKGLMHLGPRLKEL